MGGGATLRGFSHQPRNSPSDPLSLFGSPPLGNRRIAGGLSSVTGIKWPASRFSYKTLSPEVGTQCSTLRPTPRARTWVALWGPQGRGQGVLLPARPREQWFGVWIPEAACLASNPAASATLGRLLTFLCLRFPIYGTRTSTPNSEDGGENERNVAGVWAPCPTCPHWVS